MTDGFGALELRSALWYNLDSTRNLLYTLERIRETVTHTCELGRPLCYLGLRDWHLPVLNLNPDRPI